MNTREQLIAMGIVRPSAFVPAKRTPNEHSAVRAVRGDDVQRAKVRKALAILAGRRA